MSLPTKEKYEELKEKRKQEQEKRLEQERLVRFCTIYLSFSYILKGTNTLFFLLNRWPRKL